MDQPTQTNIKVTRIEGESTILHCVLKLELDVSDQAALDRLGRVFRELIPEEKRAQFAADLERALHDALTT